MQAVARAGLGVAPLPCDIGDRDPALVRIRGPIAAMAATLWVLIHPDLRRVVRIRVFVDFVVQELMRQRALIEGRSPRKETTSAARAREPMRKK